MFASINSLSPLTHDINDSPLQKKFLATLLLMNPRAEPLATPLALVTDTRA